MTQSLAIPRVIPNDWKRLGLIINKIKFRLGSASSPTFAGVTITGLTASSLVGIDTDNALESVTIGASLNYTRPTLDTIQDIRTSATPTFTGLHINSAEVVSTTLLTLESDINNNNEYNEILFKVVGGQNYGAIRSCIGIPAGDSYMSFFTTTDGGTLVRQVTIQDDGKVGFGTFNPGTLLEMVSTAPYLTLHNITEEDTDGGGESRIIGKRQDGSGTPTAAGQIEISHDGSGANDQLGKIVLSVNTGAGLVEGMRLNSNIRLGIGIGSGLDPRGGLTVLGDIDILHTAIISDDHAFEIDLDAAGMGDVKAIDIDYITGDISKGKDEGVILINVDEFAATGAADVFGLEVLATEGSAVIFGMKVGAVVGAIHQDSGTFVNPDIGTNDTDQTPVANMIDGDPDFTTDIFLGFDDYIIIGKDAVFEEIEFILTTGSSGAGIKPKFEYSTGGSGFTEFFPVDGTNGFRNTGVVAWDASDLVGHAVNADTGTATTYDIKITRQRNQLSTPPVLGFMKTVATTEYIWDEGGNVNINSLTIASGIELGHASDTTLTRVSAGVIAIEGVTVAMVGGVPAAHSIASHNDTTGTGAELNTLTGGGDAGALHSHAAAYQPLDGVLTDLSALAAVADNEFIVGDGAGSYAHENAATAATSMGLGVGDSPTFSNLTVTNTFSIAGLSTTGDTQLGDNVALDNVGINIAPDSNVLIKGSFASTGSGDDFCYNNELFTHTEDDSTAHTHIYGTNSSMTVNDDLTVDGTFTAVGHKQFLEAGLTTMTGDGDPVAYLYGYHAVVDWAAASLGAANYAAIVVGFKADVTGNLGTVGNTIKWGVDISVSESAVTHYGGRFTAQGATYNYGVWGYTTGAHTTNYGLYGYAAGATTNWGLYVAAGNAFFAGDITIPDEGYIGSATTPTAIEIEADGTVIFANRVSIGTFAGEELQIRTTNAKIRVETDSDVGFADLLVHNEDQSAQIEFVQYGSAFGGVLLGLARANGAFFASYGSAIMGVGTRTEAPLVLCSNNVERMRFLTDGGITVSSLKSGANQVAAGAATNELWVDTADQTIKRGT